MSDEDANAPQPPPVPNDKPAIWKLIVADMEKRNAMGTEKYGVPLQPHNGRDALVDAYQEALDLVAYLRQEIEERRIEREVTSAELAKLRDWAEKVEARTHDDIMRGLPR